MVNVTSWKLRELILLPSNLLSPSKNLPPRNPRRRSSKARMKAALKIGSETWFKKSTPESRRSNSTKMITRLILTCSPRLIPSSAKQFQTSSTSSRLSRSDSMRFKMASKPKLAKDPRAERDQVLASLVAKRRTLIMVNQQVKVVNRACFRKPNNCENNRTEETA